MGFLPWDQSHLVDLVEIYPLNQLSSERIYYTSTFYTCFVLAQHLFNKTCIKHIFYDALKLWNISKPFFIHTLHLSDALYQWTSALDYDLRTTLERAMFA